MWKVADRLMKQENSNKEMNDEIKKQIEEIALKVIQKYNKTAAFINQKLTDTPTDAFSLVNRRFVTLSSNIGARPVSSVAIVGQRYFNTTANQPIWFTAGGWRDATSSVVAGHL